MPRGSTKGLCLCAGLLLLLGGAPGYAATCTEAQAVAVVVSVQGSVRVNGAAVDTGAAVCPADLVQVGPFARAALRLHANQAVIRLDQETQLRLPAAPRPQSSLLELLRGALFLFTREPRAIDVKTRYADAAVEGTEFVVQVSEQRTLVTVIEGRVLTRNRLGQLRLGAYQSAVAFAGQAPRLVTTVKPDDAVQWALYYQPLVAALGESPPAGAAELEAALTRPSQPPAQPDAAYHNRRAALLLTAGQAAAAGRELARALRLAPGNAAALALQAVIAVSQNRRAQALELTARALQQNPASVAALLAQSYARQAVFDLDGALASVDAVLARAPDNALAWARRAELRLALGEPARAAAERAAALAPRLARPHTVLGFVALTGNDLADAERAFGEAIRRDQSAPLARLGLGLTRIRRGELHAGRAEIETAVALDPGSALLRSYLGKAYFEERRDALAREQFALAEHFDPRDPTPHYYDAILLGANHRPLPALRALERSMALNDNRAVYRSRLLLDQDRAARGARLARLYRVLGFDQRALTEAVKSLATDPSQAAAHRFLSDVYAGRPRHEIGRVSELLQAQLLQPLSGAPLQPRLAETNLALLAHDGLGDPGLHEYGALFTRDGVNLLANGLAGGNASWGEELVLSGVRGDLAYSVGQFHYQSDGFRRNNDLEHDIVNGFVHWQPDPALSLQFELIDRDSDYGDLDQRFDPEDFSSTARVALDIDTLRLGLRYSPGTGRDLLASYIHQELSERSASDAFDPGIGLRIDETTRDHRRGDLGELQYRHQGGPFSALLGAGWTDERGAARSELVGTIGDGPAFPLDSIFSDTGSEHRNAYGYLTLRQLNLALTVGLSYDDYRDLNLDQQTLNPKLGLLWSTPTTTVRLAGFKAVKRPLLANRTLEPTQLVGFNQFFDDLDGSRSRNYGAALERRFGPLSVGGELFWRRVELPDIPAERQRERSHRGYLYWAPNDWLAVSLEHRYESFERDLPRAGVPKTLTTRLTPLRLSYRFSERLFAALTTTHVDQKLATVSLNDRGEVTGEQDRERFVTVDTILSYRLPGRIGSVGLAVNNLFDRRFRYQDRNFQTTSPRTPEFYPERTLFLDLSVSF